MLLAASRLVLRELETRNVARESFAFETTLVGRSYLRLVERLRQQGWRVKLIDLALPSPEMSALRVAERVAHGGHSIPLSDIRRRFPRSLRHLLHDFSPRVDRCTCFMNHAFRPVLVFERKWTFAHDPRSQLVSAAAQRGLAMTTTNHIPGQPLRPRPPAAGSPRPVRRQGAGHQAAAGPLHRYLAERQTPAGRR